MFEERLNKANPAKTSEEAAANKNLSSKAKGEYLSMQAE